MTGVAVPLKPSSGLITTERDSRSIRHVPSPGTVSSEPSAEISASSGSSPPKRSESERTSRMPVVRSKTISVPGCAACVRGTRIGYAVLSRAVAAVAPSPSPPEMPIGATSRTSSLSGAKRTVAVSRSSVHTPTPSWTTRVPSAEAS